MLSSSWGSKPHARANTVTSWPTLSSSYASLLLSSWPRLKPSSLSQVIIIILLRCKNLIQLLLYGHEVFRPTPRLLSKSRMRWIHYYTPLIMQYRWTVLLFLVHESWRIFRNTRKIDQCHVYEVEILSTSCRVFVNKKEINSYDPSVLFTIQLRQ